MVQFIHVAEARDGAKHSIGITAEGKAFSWGRNNFGQLGRPSSSKSSMEAAPIDYNRGDKNNATTAVQLRAFVGGSSDSGHSALLDTKGRVWLAGCDRWQQLGLGSASAGSAGYTWNQGHIWRNSFVLNHFLEEIAGPVRDISLGGDHTVVLSCNQRDVFVFGKGGEGQLGMDGKPFVSAPTRSKILSSKNNQQLISAVCAIQDCSVTLDDKGQIMNKAGKCRKISDSLVACIRRAKGDGLVSSNNKQS
jgi:alpha-tubulin suppressor-like RCC1 family protein